VSIIKDIWVKFKLLQIKAKEKLTQKKLKHLHEHDQRLVQKLASNKKIPTFQQLGYIYKYLSKTELLIIRILCGIIAVAFCSLMINGYWSHSSLVPKAGGTYTEGLVGTPRYINPLFSQGNDVDLDMTNLIFSGLFRFTNSGVEKDLAADYQISSDQLNYTINLRQDILWHDDEKFDADDVIFTFNRINDNRTKTPLFYNFQGMKVEKIDDFTVKFILKQPFAPFLESLTVGILPEHIWRNIQPENIMLAEYNLKPIGSGPYKFKSLTKNKNGEIKSFKLEKNVKYYLGEPYIDEIGLKFYDDFEQAVEALNNKQIDGISYLPKEIRARIINNRNINFRLLNLPQYTAVFFNYDNNPILKDLTIRKILAHATNKEKIVNEILNAEAQIIDSCLLPSALGYNPDIVKFPYNVQHAKDELEKAGWKLTEYKPANITTENKEEKDTDNNAEQSDEVEGTDATPETEQAQVDEYPYPVRKLKDRYLEFNLTTVNQPENVKIVKELQKEWQQIGAKINLVIVNPENIQATIRGRDYQALLYGQILGQDPDPYPFWHSSQKTYPGLNLTSLNNPDIDKLLEDARNTSDDAKRAEKYSKFQTLLAESAPAIFLFNPTYTYPQSKKIKNFNVSNILTPANRFSQVYEWYIKTDRQWKK